MTNDPEPDVPIVSFYNSNGSVVLTSGGMTINGTINGTSFISRPFLFGAWIQETKQLQEQFYGKNFEEFSQQELVEWVRINVLAAEDELHEALGEISWKPWASAEYFNREAFLGEIVDVLHFVANLLAGAGVSDTELNSAYLEKMERNRQRQLAGYTGTDKCTGCKRALDDIAAHDGYIAQGDGRGNQWCDTCANADGRPQNAFDPKMRCAICAKLPAEIPGYYFRFWVSNSDHPTVHTTGYGCNGCFCEPGDDWK